MIDPLTTAAMPQPSRSNAREAQPGAPSFLQWTQTHAESGFRQDDPSGTIAEDGSAVADAPTIDPLSLVPASAVVGPQAPVDATVASPPIRIDTHPDIAQPMPAAVGFVPLASGPLATAIPDIDAVALPAADARTNVEVPAGVSESPHPQENAALSMQFELRKPQGEREILALPWRLVANGRLAQSHAGGASPFVPGETRAVGISAGHAPTASAPTARIDGLSRAETSTAPSIHAEERILPLRSSAIEARDAGRSAPAHVGMASSPFANEWLARIVKWIERDGHDPALWLRDYRIGDAEARRVVDTLRGLAREQGISLERIVVNGREFWRNPSHESNRTKE